MNIKFTKVKWKNLLSYGNSFSEYEFKLGLDIITGVNGAGKSTQSDALFYGLFGKPFRKIKNGSLINDTTNKGLEVHVYFTVSNGGDETEYLIKRGQKKNIFVIYKKIEDDYVEIPEKATTKEYQSFLENEILKMDDTVFRQLISISANMDSSKSFMDLTPKEKESLFQVITDTRIFNSLTDKIKLRIQDTKLRQKDIEYKLKIIESSIESEKIMIEQAKKQNNDFIKHHEDNIKHTLDNISITKENIEKYQKGIEKLKELKEKYDELMDELNEAKIELTDINIEAQSYSEEKLKNIAKEYNEKIDNLEQYYDSLDDNVYADIRVNISLLEAQNKDAYNEINDLNAKISNIEAAIKGSIKCKSCNEINYIIDIDEAEVDNLSSYKDRVTFLNTSIKENNLKISEINSEIKEKKENDKIEYQKQKSYIFEKKQKQEEIAKEEHYNFKRAERDELQGKILNLEKTIESYKEKLLKSKHIKSTLQENEESLKYYEEKLKQLNSVTLIEINEDSLNDKIEQRDITKKDMVAENKMMQDLNYLLNMLSDKGENNLKGQVIARTVPFLNKGINYFLERFSLNEFNFVIDENFKERIISRENHSEYNSLSNGQKMRISFSILFSFLRLIEEKNGITTNLLFLDEILDGSLDSSGREELLYILKNEFSDKKNIIIISHNEEIKGKDEVFDRAISVQRDKFSKILVEDIK